MNHTSSPCRNPQTDSGTGENALDPLWGELFPAEQARIVRALVDRVVVGPEGADIRPRVEGLAGLVRDLAPDALRTAA
jgi:hypothetical protein